MVGSFYSKIYQKYIFRNVLPIFSMLAVILTGLVWITQTLRMMHLIDKGMELKYFFQLTMFLIPSILFVIFPIILVIAMVYVYHRLQEDRQLVILKNSGLSNYALAKPALFFAMILTVFSYYISAYLMPMSYNNMKQNLSNFYDGHASNMIVPRSFNRISKNSNIYVDTKNADGSFGGMILFDNKVPEERTIFFAKHARILNSDPYNTEFVLEDGLRHAYDTMGNLTKLHYDNLVVAITSEPADPSARSRTSLELYIGEMLWPDSSLVLEKQQRLIADGHLRIIWPLLNFVLVFLSLSIFLQQPYNRRQSFMPFLITFVPVVLVVYIHFLMQKIAYQDIKYIWGCYLNIIICVLFSAWQSTRSKL